MFSTSSTSCLNRLGKPLRAYPDRATADEAARHADAAYGHRMVPYRCGRCREWHLCPENRHTPSRECHWCEKRAYETDAHAERRSKILREEQGVELRVYECPHGEGWHLTSSL